MDSGDADANEELQRMYNELESWRLNEEKRLVTTSKTSMALRYGRANLVSQEALKLAQLAAKRDKNKLMHKEDVMRNIILKAGQPRTWVNTTGRFLQLETPETQRARDFADVYVRLTSEMSDDDLDTSTSGSSVNEERAATLHALANLVGSLIPCQTGDDLLDLIEREEEMMKRGVKATNLMGVRQRILSLFLQLVRSPDHNPEIVRYERQLPVPVMHSSKSSARRKSIQTEFCQSCRRHLPRAQFKSATGSGSAESGADSSTTERSGESLVRMGKCVNCERLDNNARTRQDLTVYKSMLNRIRKEEEASQAMTSPLIYHLQDSDIRYIVRSLWDSRSILSGNPNLYDLRLMRWHKNREWSPWNCVLLTKDEADIHLNLDNLHKVCLIGYTGKGCESGCARKIRGKQTVTPSFETFSWSYLAFH